MKFFHYSQNNSGGHFDIDLARGITTDVIIEAESASDADERAERIGLYFDGCDNDLDCPCCGDRWYRQWGEGDDVPSIYSTPILEHDNSNPYRSEAAVHYADGRFEIIPF